MKFVFCSVCKDTGRHHHLILGEIPCQCLEHPSNPKMTESENVDLSDTTKCPSCNKLMNIDEAHYCPGHEKRNFQRAMQEMDDLSEKQTEKAQEPIPFAWESMGPTASRARVFGGWVLRIYAADRGAGAHIFIEDRNHEWKIEEPPPGIVEGRPYR